MLEQSSWWLLPFVLMMLVMLHAMMEFTVCLLARPPQSRRDPLPADELRRRLLAINESDPPHPLVTGKDCDLEIAWEVEKPPPAGRFAVSRAATRGRLRLLLDESRRELRLNQVSSSYYFFLGLSGWLPRLSGYAGAGSGPPEQGITEEIGRIAGRGGWSTRPVLWWFQATYGGFRLLESLTPAPLRKWPARRFWGVIYPLSFFLGIGYLVAVLGPLDRDGLLLAAGISAIWWGGWGLLVWILLGLPR